MQKSLFKLCGCVVEIISLNILLYDIVQMIYCIVLKLICSKMPKKWVSSLIEYVPEDVYIPGDTSIVTPHRSCQCCQIVLTSRSQTSRQ